MFITTFRFRFPRQVGADQGPRVVSFTLSDASSPLSLDFASAPAGHLVYPSSALHAGENHIEIDFDAGDAPLNRNDEFLYTIFVARAHGRFPVSTSPIKARWTLSLDVPEG
jgi:aminopeptidase N